MYTDARVAVKVRGRINTPLPTHCGVKQGCPLSPTLFGVFMDGLDRWLRTQAPTAGVSISCEGGGERLLSHLMYADDVALLAPSAAGLQQLLDALGTFCRTVGLDISLSKTKIMSFHTTSSRSAAPAEHRFMLGNVPLADVDQQRYLGVNFSASGHPQDYLRTHGIRLTAQYHTMRQRYFTQACGKDMRVQLHCFDSYVRPVAEFGAVLWGVRPGLKTERQTFARRYLKHLRQLLRVLPSVCGDVLLQELEMPPLSALWMGAALHFWNRVVQLPAGDLCRDVLFDSLSEASRPVPAGKGFAAGVLATCTNAGYVAASPQHPLALRQLDIKFIMEQWHSHRWAAKLASVPLDPRTCPSRGASLCKYRRWFQRDMGGGAKPRAGVYRLSVSPRKLTAFLRFKVGSGRLPCVTGHHHRPPVPRPQRWCPRCPPRTAVGDERHLIFECPALADIRAGFASLFTAHTATMRQFINQSDQRGVLNFVVRCLDYDALPVGQS